MNGYFTTSGKPLTGEIRGGLFSSSSLPAGWLACDGSELDAVKYPRLAALIAAADDGKKYLPNLQGKALRGADNENVSGSSGGENSAVLQESYYGVQGGSQYLYYATNGQTVDTRGASLYVNFIIYAL